MLFIADNLRITQKAISDAVREKNPKPIQDLVRLCEKAGADGIDINSGPLYRNPESIMTFLVETVQEVTRLPLVMDTSNPEAMKAGLLASKNHTVINGVSLEPSRLRNVLSLAQIRPFDLVGYLLYPNGHVPPDSADRLEIAVSLYQKCVDAGIEPDRLIIDPVGVPLSWENGVFQAAEVLKVIRTLPELLDFPIRTIAGLSNLAAGAQDISRKQLAEQTYLPMLAASGLSMALMNILHAETVRTARMCRVFSQASIFTWEQVG